MAAWLHNAGESHWNTTFLFNVPRSEWRRIAAVSPDWLIDGRMPDYMSVADKAGQVVRYDRRLDYVARRRAERKEE